MSLIDVPGEDLMRVHDLLQQVSDLLNGVPGSTQGFDELGQSDLEGAAHNFESRWSYGRSLVGKDLQKVRDAAKSVADAFQKTDNRAVSKLQQARHQAP